MITNVLPPVFQITVYMCTSHTYKDDRSSLWEMGKFDPRHALSLDRSPINLRGWLRDGYSMNVPNFLKFASGFRLHTCATLGTLCVLGYFSYIWVFSRDLQPRPLNGFWNTIRQHTCFCARLFHLGPENNSIFKPPFREKTIWLRGTRECRHENQIWRKTSKITRNRL